jgi:hypothetical protein
VGSRERPIPLPSEGAAQRAFVRELRTSPLLLKSWRWTRFSAGDVPDEKWAGVMHAMGVNPGWPDLCFASPKRIEQRDSQWTVTIPAKLHGMEWKHPNGDLRDEQREVRAWFLDNGWEWATVTDSVSAWKALQSWGALRFGVRL